MPLPRMGDILQRKFSGEQSCNPYAHWLEWEDYCELYNLTPQQSVDRFKHTLTGDAREWICDKQFNNVAELKDEFIQYFSGLSSRAASLEAFRSLKWTQGECIEKYAKRVIKLGDRLGLGDELVKQQFLDGFPIDMKTAIFMTDPQDLEDMKKMAQRFADLQRERQVQVASHFAIQSNQSTQIDMLTREMSELKAITQSLVHQDHFRAYRPPHREGYRSGANNRGERSRERESRSSDRSYHRSRESRSSDRSYHRSRESRSSDRSYNRSRDRQRHHSRSHSRGRRESREEYKSGRRQDRSQSGPRQVRMRDQTPHNISLECWYCHKKGHGWKQCDQLGKDLAADKISAPKDF